MASKGKVYLYRIYMTYHDGLFTRVAEICIKLLLEKYQDYKSELLLYRTTSLERYY